MKVLKKVKCEKKYKKEKTKQLNETPQIDQSIWNDLKKKISHGQQKNQFDIEQRNKLPYG